MYIGLHVKYLSFLSDFNKTLIFSTDFRKILKQPIQLKSVPWQRVVSCGEVDRRTDMTKLVVAFLNFVNAPKNSLH
jgi:hypothetical protein